MARLWFSLALVGAVVPWYFFYQELALTGSLGLQPFLVTSASTGALMDLIISSVAFWVLIFSEPNRLETPKLILLVAVNLGIGLSCALPLYLYFKTQKGTA